MIHEAFLTKEHDYRECFHTKTRPRPDLGVYDTNFVDPQIGRDPSWDGDLNQQVNLEYEHNHIERSDRIKSNNLIRDSYVTYVLQYALFSLWTVNPQIPDTSPPLPRFPPKP